MLHKFSLPIVQRNVKSVSDNPPPVSIILKTRSVLIPYYKNSIMFGSVFNTESLNCNPSQCVSGNVFLVFHNTPNPPYSKSRYTYITVD